MTDTTIDTQYVQPWSLRRAAIGIWRVGLTMDIPVLAVLAVQFGSQKLARKAEAAPAPQAAPTIPVATKAIVLSPSCFQRIGISFAGGILFSSVVSFHSTPPAFALVHKRVASKNRDKMAQIAAVLPLHHAAE